MKIVAGGVALMLLCLTRIYSTYLSIGGSVHVPPPKAQAASLIPSYDPVQQQMYRSGIKTHRLAVYTHIDDLLLAYPFSSCTEDVSVCIAYMQNNLFVMSGYNASQGVDGFIGAWKKYTVRHRAHYYHLPVEKKLLVDHLESIIDQLMFLTRQPLQTHHAYTTDIVGLLRGLQLYIKYALLMLDPSGEGLPRDAQPAGSVVENALRVSGK